MLLEGQVAVVTGAGSGIGRAGAEAMAREGAHVVIVDRDRDRAKAAAAAIRDGGHRAEALALDVTDDPAVGAALADIHDRFGRIDILHNHAGVQVAGDVTGVDPDGFDLSWAVNVRAQFRAARAVVPMMKAVGHGVILNTSSSSGVLYDREMIAYTTSKHAVVAMTRQMAGDLARHGIRVNALCPGWVDTPFNDPFARQMGGRAALERYVAEQVPMGRWASLDEMAEPILFLVSARSSYMTGQVLVVDGGETVS
jgi:NAD(P)-dependent dehydrogenase (short-subunit alcohol dehydrogenase family)